MVAKVALIGYGYWGPNLLRNLFENPHCEVKYCCDLSEERLKLAKKRYPSITLTSKLSQVIEDPEIDGIVIATPTKTHYPISKKALSFRKHVLIEKPMTMNTSQAKVLVSLAEENKVSLMVDHTFLFNDAVIKIKKLIDKGGIGKVLYIDSVRANLGLFQPDVNVIYDLASHDFSIIQYLLESKPVFIKAEGKANFNKQEDVAYVKAQYPGSVFAHVHVSWLSPLKIRRMMIVGSKKMIVYDDTEVSEKVRVYDKGVVLENGSENTELIKINYRTGDVWMPKIDAIEPLSLLMDTFIKSMKSHKLIKSGGNFCLNVMEILEAATHSLRTERRVNL